MFGKLSLIVFKSIKIYSVGYIFYDTLIGAFTEMGIDVTTLTYTIAIEMFFIFLKSSQIEVPLWMEAAQDIV